eukprot:c17595_g2_i1 orf=347-1357(+)
MGEPLATEEPIIAQGSIPEQRCYPSMGISAFPYVFVPASGDICKALPKLLEGIRKQKDDIEQALHQSGAILFRGFEVLSASDFNDVLEALGYENFVFKGRGTSNRKTVVGRVTTTNDKPLHYPIGFHNEMSYQPLPPSKISFYCDVEPPEGAGGATPILPGHVVYQRLEKEMPEFLEMLETKGLIYIRVLSSDPSRSRNDCWQAVYQAATKKEAENKAKEGDTCIQWNEDGTATSFFGPRSAIRMDPSRGRKVWFNSIGATYELVEEAPAQNGMSFGDGFPMSKDLMGACKKVMEEEKTAFRWRKGDVLLLDNFAVLHAREPSKPPRKILVALCGN